ncbi:hypothetical protein ElyMa_005871900 [Elysia marginata]|uniref:Uncharacterized protein n=1 Tax=Elysia marginata TaxID=1093978 RepID=A0AAV4G0W8_9GAST|nr:hypothetical protein ElyMa_005871900 [Elysia marginata]
MKIYKDWITQESLDNIQEGREIKGELNRCSTWTEKKETQENHSIAHLEVNQSIKRDKNRFLEGQRQLSKQVQVETGLGHQITKAPPGKQSKPATPVKDQKFYFHTRRTAGKMGGTF